MYLRNQPRPLTIALVILLQELACLFIQGRVWIRINEETFDGEEDMPDAVGRLPVFLEGVHTDLSPWADVGVEDLSREPAYRTCCQPHSHAQAEGAYILEEQLGTAQ